MSRLNLLAAIVFLTSIALPASAADIVWTNLNGGLWSAATNWSPNQVPGSADNAVITNAGTYTVTNNTGATLTGLIVGDTNSPGTPKLLISAGTLTATNTAVASNGVIFLSAGTVVSAGPTTIAGTFNQANGTWQLKAAASVNNYNLTNGELRGGTLTVTNLNWLGGSMNADTNGDRTIIPANGTLNFPGATTRNLSYNSPATRGRDLDNYGAWTWSGDCLLYGVGAAVVNNYGTVNATGTANSQFTYYPGYPGPTWNNVGTFTKSIGPGIFYFTAMLLSNSGTLGAQAGTVSFNSSTVRNSGPISLQNATLQAYASTCTNSSSLTLDATSLFTVDNGGTFDFGPGASLTSPGVDRVRVNSGTVTVQTTNVVATTVLISGGTFWQQTNNTIPTINESSGTWRLSATTTVGTYNLTNGELRGGTLTVTNLNWLAGSMNADANGDRTIIPTNGTLNFPGTATRNLSYNSPATRGRDLDNYGTWTWSGDCLLYGVGAAVVNNYGTVNVTGTANSQFTYYPGYPGPTWNNFGNFTKTAGPGIFYFASVALNNSGSLTANAGTLSINSTTFNNSGLVSASGTLLQFYASTSTNTGSISLAPATLLTVDNGGTLGFGPAAALSAPGSNTVRLNSGSVYLNTTNVTTPALWINGAVLYLQTNFTPAVLNQSAGTLQPLVPAALGIYNLTNGELRGADCVITNFNWLGGSLNSDTFGTNITIPTNGTLNISGATAKPLSAYTGLGRVLLNLGSNSTWSGAGITGYYGAQFRNQGTMTLSADLTFSWGGNPYGPAAVFYNSGQFIKTNSPGAFTLSSVNFLNDGAMIAYSGSWVFNGGTVGTNNGGFYLPGGGFVDLSCTYMKLIGPISSPAANSVRFNATTVDLNANNLVTPTLWIQTGLVNQNTNVTVPIYNQSGGEWRPTLPVAVATYNFTNGTIRGANSTITNLTWLAGNLTSDGTGSNVVTVPATGTLTISGAGAKALYSNLGQGRTLLNQGTATWSGAGISGYYGAIFRNEGSLTIPADLAYSWPGNPYSPACLFDNAASGTVTKSAGTANLAFTTVYFNNAGTFNVQAGTLQLNGTTSATNSGALNFSPSTIFDASCSALLLAGSVSAPTANSVRFNTTTVDVNTTNLATPTIWIQAGLVNQNTNVVVPVINQSSGEWRPTLPVAVGTYNFTNGTIRGANSILTNLTWLAGNLTSDGTGSNVVTVPTGGTLTISSAGAKALYSNLGQGRTLLNQGTATWSGAGISGYYGAIFRNENLLTVSGDLTYSWPGNPYSPACSFDNAATGTVTKSAGTANLAFTTVYFNNAGTFNVQAGTLQLNGTTSATNSGALNFSASTIFDVSCASLQLGGSVTAPTANSVRFNATTVDVNTTNLATPTVWVQTGTVNQNTNVVVPVINQSGGEWRPTLPVSVATYNFTNGTIRGANSTLTNLTWLAGNLTSDGTGSNVVTVPFGGTLTISSAGAKALYSNLGQGRTLLNQGTATWSGAGISGYYGAIFRNENLLTVSGDLTYSWPGNPYGPAAAFQNTGTVTRNSGSGNFTLGSLVVNNSGTMDVQTGTLSISGCTFTNQPGGNLLSQAGAVVANDGGSTSVFESGSSVGCVSTNAFRINSGTVTLRTTGITAPSMWINGGTLNQDTNVVVAEINQSGGVWRPSLPVSATTYNFTNGELRGANVTLTTFNWLGGAVNSDGPGSNTVTVSSSLKISTAAAKSLSYNTLPGRSLINNGTATWGGSDIAGAGAATFRNNGTLTVTNDVAFVYSSGTATVFHNAGTYAKTNGTGVANFGSTTITNSGTMTVSSGSFTVGGAFTQTAGSAHLGTNFTASAALRVEAGTFTGRGTIGGAFYNNGIVNPGASPGLISGATFTNTGAATVNFELGGTNAVTNFDAVRLTGAATLDGTLKVLLVNGFAPQLSNSFEVMRFASRAGTYASIVPPPGVGLTPVYSATNLVLNVTGLSNAPLEIVTAPTNVTVWEPDPATFFVVASGVTPVTYQWQFNSVNIPGATNATYTVSNTVVTNGGTYTVVVTDGLAATTNASATLTVIPFVGTIYWVNTNGGDWHTAANWEPARVPGPTNTAVIVTNGTYTVNISAAAAVSNLIVGVSNATGSPTVHLVSPNTLALGANSVFETNAVLALNGTLQMAGGTNHIRGRIDWQFGTLAGPGRTLITNGAVLTFYGSLNQKFISGHVLENRGTFNYGNDSFGNAQGLRFSGGAQLTNHPSGIINIGTAAYDYSGSQTPRSYLVNYGTINANSANIFSPSYISIDFLNYGTLQDNGYTYISRGTNYGTFAFGNTLCEVSVFGDEGTGEYFSFEDGTTFVGTQPLLAVGGYAQWNTTAPHPGNVRVLSGSGGYSFASPEFRVLKNYTQTGTTTVNKGRWTMANSNLVADLNVMTDSIVNGFHSFVISNAGTINVTTLNHTIRNLANGGTINVRSNLATADSVYGGGKIIIGTNASSVMNGGAFSSQLVQNFGTNQSAATVSFDAPSRIENKPGAVHFHNGANFTGGGSFSNAGTLFGRGSFGITVTNTALVRADYVSTLSFTHLVQTAGSTWINVGGFSGSPGSLGGGIEIFGGELRGTNFITGSLFNNAQFTAGDPAGRLAISGNYTNTVNGVHNVVIGSASNYSRVDVGGAVDLLGTLNISFTNGWVPVPGNIYTALTFTARSGTFSVDNAAAMGLTAQYSASNLLLLADNLLPTVVIAAPPASSLFNCICEPFVFQANASDADGSISNVTLLWNSNLVAVLSNAPYRVTLLNDVPGFHNFTAVARDNRGGETTTNLTVRFIGRGGTNVLNPYLVTAAILTNVPVIPKFSVKLCLEGEPGRDYDLETNTNLLTTNWSVLGQMTFSNGMWRYYDTNAPSFKPERYYRAVRLPRVP